jgi:hypothetical protein
MIIPKLSVMSSPRAIASIGKPGIGGGVGGWIVMVNVAERMLHLQLLRLGKTGFGYNLPFLKNSLQHSPWTADHTQQNRCSTYGESNCWMHYNFFYLKHQEDRVFHGWTSSLSLIIDHSCMQD